ncbi:MAG: hypothetical protein AB1411_06630 [Nitrospirota bacterium]
MIRYAKPGCAKPVRVVWLFMLAAATGSLPACEVKTVPRPNAPFLIPSQREAAFYQAAAHEQDARLATCAKTRSCDRAHFARALVALHESRESAARHFQEVLAIAPNGPLADSSRTWLRLLKEASMARPDTPYGRATEQLVRDFLEADAASAQTLQREVKAREKKVEDLTRQLEALKQIDQELKEKARSKKPSTKPDLHPHPGKDGLP